MLGVLLVLINGGFEIQGRYQTESIDNYDTYQEELLVWNQYWDFTNIDLLNNNSTAPVKWELGNKYQFIFKIFGSDKGINIAEHSTNPDDIYKYKDAVAIWKANKDIVYSFSRVNVTPIVENVWDPIKNFSMVWQSEELCQTQATGWDKFTIQVNGICDPNDEGTLSTFQQKYHCTLRSNFKGKQFCAQQLPGFDVLDWIKIIIGILVLLGPAHGLYIAIKDNSKLEDAAEVTLYRCANVLTIDLFIAMFYKFGLDITAFPKTVCLVVILASVLNAFLFNYKFLDEIRLSEPKFRRELGQILLMVLVPLDIFCWIVLTMKFTVFVPQFFILCIGLNYYAHLKLG